jgi:hypothetical protein
MSKSKKSPWLDFKHSNLISDELSFAEDPVPGEQNKPMEAFKWIHENNAKDLLFKSLAEFAPLFPVISYHGEISSWLSPPPSGSGNAIFIIIGKDGSGRLRSVGGNYFNSDVNATACSSNFWIDYDNSEDDLSRLNLMSEVLGYYKKYYSYENIREIERCSDFSCSMPIYILVLDNNIGHMAVAPAMVRGYGPADFSYEKIKEVRV